MVIDLSTEEEEKTEPLEEENPEKRAKLPKGPACPIYPASVKDIMHTFEKLDRGEIDDFDAMKEISTTLKEHRAKKLSALENAETSQKPEKPLT